MPKFLRPIAASTLLLSLTLSGFARADAAAMQCVEANESALKLRKERQFRAAVAQFVACMAQICPGEVRAECERNLGQTVAAMPSVVFEARDSAGADIAAVTVTLRGKVLVERLDGGAIDMDPGEQEVTFQAAGQPPVTQKLVIREGEKRRIVTFRVGPDLPPPTKPEVVRAVSPPPVYAEPSSSARRTVGYITAGVGVVGVGLGTFFGLSAASKWSDAKIACGSGCDATDPAQRLKNDAQSAGVISTISFISGGVLLAGGLALVLTAPSSKPSGIAIAPAIGPGGAGLIMRGSL